MKRVEVLIEQILRTPSKSSDCNCGCGGCQKKKQAPVLREGKVKHLLSEGLRHHLDEKVPLFDCKYRRGSEEHLALIREARKLYSRGIIEVSDADKELLETDLGHYGEYKGEIVPLDLPMENPLMMEARKIMEDIKLQGAISPQAIRKMQDQIENNHDLAQMVLDFMIELARGKDLPKDKNLIDAVDSLQQLAMGKERMIAEEEKKLTYDNFVQMVRDDMNAGSAPDEYVSDEQIRKDAKHLYNRYLQGASVDDLFEAEYQGRKVKLNKPMQGDVKKFKVYVKNPKGNVVKVNFGDPNMRIKNQIQHVENHFVQDTTVIILDQSTKQDTGVVELGNKLINKLDGKKYRRNRYS